MIRLWVKSKHDKLNKLSYLTVSDDFKFWIELDQLKKLLRAIHREFKDSINGFTIHSIPFRLIIKINENCYKNEGPDLGNTFTQTHFLYKFIWNLLVGCVNKCRRCDKDGRPRLILQERKNLFICQ